jgi:NAD(P)-dependent dehydrogenase (short-subunit alcohol dehydrogenase family)
MTPEQHIRAGLAVVTGAGGGLGRALSVELTKAGMRVAGMGRDRAALEETGARCEAGRFTPVICDVSDPSSVAAAFAGLDGVAVLVNNAAIYPRRGFLEETPESFMATVNTNLGGVVACTHAALGQMVQTGIGRILNVATFADLAPLPASAGYSVSKGAARIFTRALIADIGDRFPDIVVGDWMPGMLATRMGIPDGLSPETAARWGAALALWHDRSLTGAVFEMDREILTGRGLKGRIKDLILLRKRKSPRQIRSGLNRND